jgi:hypothetical protein
MEKLFLMDQVNGCLENRVKINAIRRLGAYIEDPVVLDALCREAIETDSHRVREALINTLKSNPNEANQRFTRIVICSKNPTHRRWALINLSLMACRNAKEAVMHGLRDPHRSVRIAAAFNAGLYCDSDVANALELFFERDRPLFIVDSVCQAVKPLLPLMKKLGGLYSEYYHHDGTKSRREQRA